MSEEWKDIYFEENGKTWDYRGLYQVSNTGFVKSLNYKKTGKEKILQQTKNNKNYLTVSFRKNGKEKRFLVHRLVAIHFVPNPENKPCVDHIIPISEGGTNNADNLRWTTQKENLNNEISKIKHRHAMSNRILTEEWKNKISNSLKGDNSPRYNKGIKVLQFDMELNFIKCWNNAEQVQRELNIDSRDIGRCCKFWEMSCDKEKWFQKYKRRPQKSAGGYIWKYYKEGDENE